MVLAANASSWTARPERASAMALCTMSRSNSVPLATTLSPTSRSPPTTETSWPSRRSCMTSLPTLSISGIPASTRISGPRLGYRPEMEDAAFTTAAGRQARRASALTLSMSWWSMTAISPGRSRLVRFFVLGSTRTVPRTPGLSGSRARWRGILRGISPIVPCRDGYAATHTQARGCPPGAVA